MASKTELLEFVKEGLQRGLPKSELETALLNAGWDKAQVGNAIRSFADVDFAIPVPRPTPYLSPREAFMYVLLFSTLYLSAYHLGDLVFELINQAFPDPASQQSAEWSLIAIRWSTASLVVAFPVFLSVAWTMAREVRADSTKRASRIRRQLTYLTLFIASSVLIGDVTTLVYNFLGGELTVRFLLKIVTVAIIAGAAFAYYLRELHIDEKAMLP